jgi:hypothetical protein
VSELALTVTVSMDIKIWFSPRYCL